MSIETHSDKKIDLQIFSPEKVVFEDRVDSIVFPAHNGEYGVLPGHAHFLVHLVEGQVKITKGTDVRFMAISGGFAHAQPDQVQIFAETAELGEEIDQERARLALERAKKSVSSAADPKDLELANASLRRALIRLKVYEGLSKKRAHS